MGQDWQLWMRASIHPKGNYRHLSPSIYICPNMVKRKAQTDLDCWLSPDFGLSEIRVSQITIEKEKWWQSIGIGSTLFSEFSHFSDKPIGFRIWPETCSPSGPTPCSPWLYWALARVAPPVLRQCHHSLPGSAMDFFTCIFHVVHVHYLWKTCTWSNHIRYISKA